MTLLQLVVLHQTIPFPSLSPDFKEVFILGFSFILIDVDGGNFPSSNQYVYTHLGLSHE